MQPIESLKLLKQINIDYYGGAHAARQNNKFIAYVNAFTLWSFCMQWISSDISGKSCSHHRRPKDDTGSGVRG